MIQELGERFRSQEKDCEVKKDTTVIRRIPESGEGFRSKENYPRVRRMISESGEGYRSQENDFGASQDKDSRDRRRILEAGEGSRS